MLDFERFKETCIEQKLEDFLQGDVENAIEEAPAALWNKFFEAMRSGDRFLMGDVVMDMLLASADKLTPDADVQEIIEEDDREQRRALYWRLQA